MPAHINAAWGPREKHPVTNYPGKNSTAMHCLFFSKKGFTLIELIVVLALVSIVLFFAVPRFQNTVPSNSKKITARWIIANTRALRVNALKNQKRYVMYIDLDNGIMWTGREDMTAEETETAAKKSFQLPDDMKFIDVEYPGREKVTTGRADIFFYKENYSQTAFIHVEDDGYHKMTFQIKPFLPGVKIFDEYIGIQ